MARHQWLRRNNCMTWSEIEKTLDILGEQGHGPRRIHGRRRTRRPAVRRRGSERLRGSYGPARNKGRRKIRWRRRQSWRFAKKAGYNGLTSNCRRGTTTTSSRRPGFKRTSRVGYGFRPARRNTVGSMPGSFRW